MKYKKISELNENDKTFGTDGQFHPIKTPFKVETMQGYVLETSDGNVVCSGDHLWNICKDSLLSVMTTKNLFDLFNYGINYFKDRNVGTPTGPLLLGVRKIGLIEAVCITTEAKDAQFEILTDKRKPIFTHNCRQRMVCGRLDSVASRMALGNQQATTIDSNHKGAGMTSSDGTINTVQYYFENQKWIEDWFTERGLTEKGWEIGQDPNVLDEEVDLGDDDEDISIEQKTTVIDFAGEHAEVDKTKEQKFEEI